MSAPPVTVAAPFVYSTSMLARTSFSVFSSSAASFRSLFFRTSFSLAERSSAFLVSSAASFVLPLSRTTSMAAFVSASERSKLAVTTTPLFTAVSSSLAATLSAAAVTSSAASTVGFAV